MIKRFIFPVLFFLCFLQNLAAQEVYFVDIKQRLGKLQLDQCSFQIFKPQPSTVPKIIAFNPNGKLYGIGNGSQITDYNAATGSETLVKNLTGGININSMTCDSTGLFYLTSSTNDGISTFDPGTSTQKFIGSIGISGLATHPTGNFEFHQGGVYFTNDSAIVTLNTADPINSKIYALLPNSDVLTGMFDYYVCNQKKTYVVSINPTDTFPISNIYEFNWTDKSFKKVCSPAVKISRLTARYGFVPPPKIDTTYTTAATCDETLTKKPSTQKNTSLLGCETYVTTSYFIQNDTIRHDTIDCKRKVAAYSDTLRTTVSGNCKRIKINNFTPAPRRNDSTTTIVRFCEGDSTFVSNNWVKETTVYSNLFRNIYGCDSTSFLRITAAPPHDTIFKSKNICRGDTIKVGRFKVFESGDYISPIPNNLTCDTAILLSVKVISPDTTIVNRVSCNQANVGTKLLKIINPLGCYNYTLTHTMYSDNPNLTLHIGDVYHIRLGDSLILSPILNFIPQKIKWQDSLLFSCDTCLTTVIKPKESAILHLSVTNDDDCMIETSIKIFVDPNRHIFIPTAFSPNGDSVNDIFTVYGDYQVQTIKTLKVFDRWGNLVFEQDNLQPNTGWDGKFKGENLSPDIFTYFTVIKFTDGEEITYKGDVKLIK